MMHLDKLPNAQPNERIVLFIRRHWIAPLFVATMTICLLGAPIGIYFLALREAPYLFGNAIATPLIGLAASIYYLAVWAYSWSEFIDYYLDVWIVTNERIINIEQHGLFARVASELHLSAVQDATSEVRGVLKTFLDFGQVHVQTAGERTRFIFKQIPHPERVKEKIVELAQQTRVSVTPS